MTPEQIKKEQEASKMEKVQSKENAQVDKPKVDVNLEESNNGTQTPPKESKRQYGKKVQDYKTVVSEAKAKGIDLNNQEGVPLLESDKNRIIENASKLAPKELVADVVNRINTYAKPEFKDVPELDQKRLMAQERKQRRSRWADALYAFGEGLQGKTANPENFAQNRIQRKQDQEFQNYREATEYNRQSRNLWNKQVSDETLKWLDEQANNQRLDQLTREKMQAAADQYRQNMAFKEKQLAQGKQIADDRNATSIKAAAIRASSEKDKKKVTVQTAKNTYELKPEEAEFYKGEVLKNAEAYRSKYPGLFEKVQETDEWTGKPIEGKFTYKLSPRIKDVDLVRVYLEENKEGGNQKITPENQQSYFDRYRKEKGLPTSDQPLLQPNQSQSQKPKADPLGLGL